MQKKARWQILLAEDNQINQIVTKAQLTELGCQVQIAINGAEAVKATEQQDFDLIIMDCNMPQVDGYEASRQIRQREKQRGKSRTPIIAFTADVMHSEEKDCEAVGMNGYLTKPVILKDLKGILEEWLENPSKEILQSKIENIPLENSISLDIHVLNDMRRKLSSVQINRIIVLFLEELPTYVKNVQEAIISQNGEELYLAAHKFKGASLILGGQCVAALCDSLSRLGHNKVFDKTNQLLAQLKTECTTLKFLLEEQMLA